MQKLTRPGMMPWMFDDEGNLAEDQVTFDWKAVNYRADQLGGHDPNLQEGAFRSLLPLYQRLDLQYAHIVSRSRIFSADNSLGGCTTQFCDSSHTGAPFTLSLQVTSTMQNWGTFSPCLTFLWTRLKCSRLQTASFVLRCVHSMQDTCMHEWRQQENSWFDELCFVHVAVLRHGEEPNRHGSLGAKLNHWKSPRSWHSEGGLFSHQSEARLIFGRQMLRPRALFHWIFSASSSSFNCN